MIRVDLYNLRKSIHLKLFKTTFNELKIMLLRKNLSIQDFFDFVAELATTEDPRILAIADEAVKRIKQRELIKFSELDSDAIFDLLEEESPVRNTTSPATVSNTKVKAK